MPWFPHYASSPLEFILIVFLLPLAFCPSWNPIVPDVRAMQPERNYQIPAAGSSTCLLFCSACASEGKSQGNCWLARDYSRFPFFDLGFREAGVKMAQMACLLHPGFPTCGASWAWKSAAHAVKSRGSWEKAFLFFSDTTTRWRNEIEMEIRDYRKVNIFF